MTDFVMRGVVLDTETTGTEEGAQVLQLAYTELNDNLELTSNSVCTYHRPDKEISYGALATHHLYTEKLERFGATDTPAEAPSAAYYIGHNVDFDWKMLGSPPEVKCICTLALARYFWPESDGHSLGACTYRIANSFAEAEQKLTGAHDAKVDILLCYDLMRWLAEKCQVADLHSLWLLSEHARVPTVMPFGKHRGERIADIPLSYKLWALKQPDFDPYVLIAFKNTR